MKIGKLDASVYDELSAREKRVLDMIDKFSVFGGKEPNKFEAVEALNAKKLKDLFTDPEDRKIADGLLERFFPELSADKARQVHGPGMVAAPKRKLARLFAPRSIAVIGASRDPNKVGGSVVQKLKESGYSGKIIPINNKAGDVQGITSHQTIGAAPKADVALIAIPATQVAEAVRACAAKGIKNVVVLSAGFKEAGEEGRKLEAELAQIAADHDLNLVGPNCLGILTPTMNASFAAESPKWGGVGLLSQSGAVVTGMLSDLAQTGFSTVVSMGNQANLDIADYIEDLTADRNTKVIAAYLESVPDGARFVEAASKATREKPVVIIRGGKSKTGQKASSSHTGSLGGKGAAYDAAFSRAGVITAEDQQEFLDLARVFASEQPLPKGRRIAVITNAGGPAILATDAADQYGLQFAELSKATQDKLTELLPPETGPGNPLDLLGDAKSPRYKAALKLLMDDPNVDAIVCLATPQSMTDSDAIAKVMVAQSGDKPIICSFQGSSAMAVPEQILEMGGVPNFDTSERAARALARMCDYAEIKQRREFEPVTIDRDAPKLEVGTHGTETLAALKKLGIECVEQRYCADVASAASAAKSIGFPVVMKINSPDILHKTDVGGVVLNIGDEAALKSAYATMMARVAKDKPNAKIDGVEIQKQLPKGHDVIVGVADDPVFGPQIMFGLGGTTVEVFKDCTFERAPLSEAAIEDMITRIKAYPILAGVRGEKPIDFDALKDVLRRISVLADTNRGHLKELDINPLRVSPNGAWACDGRAVVA